MKKAFFLYFLAFMFLPAASFGQRIEFTKPYKYTASNDDSRNSAKTKAMEEAQAALLREIGVLVEARQKMTTKSSGNNTKEDFVEELKTYTIGKVQTTVVAGTERFTDNEKGDMVYSATFSMVVDTADLYKYLDNIVKQKQQAIDDSLLIVKKRMEEESEAARRHRAQIEQVKNDSIARAKKISELELSVRTARNLLEQEQELGKPLRIEKDKKERELKDAERQKDNTQKAFDNARNMSDINTDIGAKRVENERKLLQEATNNYNIKLSEYKIADENLKNANRKVETAKNNLRIAENNLAKEIGAQISTTTEIVVDKSEYEKAVVFAEKAVDIEELETKDGIYLVKDNKKPFTGNFVGYGDNYIITVGTMRNGKIEAYKWFYENGNLKEEGNYKDGKLHGVLKSFYDSGNLESESVYKDNELHEILKWFYKDGREGNDIEKLSMKLYLMGESLYSEEKFKESQKYFKKALKTNPKNAIAANSLGYMWAEKGINLDRARKLLLSALKEDPNDGYYLDSYGWILFKQEKYDEAKTPLLRSAELLANKNVVYLSYYHLGELYLKLGDRQEALNYFIKANTFKNNPDFEAIEKRINNLQNGTLKQVEKSKQTADGDIKSQTPKPEKINTKTNDGDIKVINGIEYVLVKAGTFTMGSPKKKYQKDYYDYFRHKVTITKDYWISKYPITNSQYGKSVEANHPVVGVTWVQANDWAKSKGGRLPTEAEWEFAARGGNKSKGYIYSGSNNLDQVGWYSLNSGGVRQPVGKKQPNELGIHDMSGNVLEWCSDWYATYPTFHVTNPIGGSGDKRVSRGGSYSWSASYCGVAQRHQTDPSENYSNLGFRIVFDAD